jgi:hypothetical protein
LKRGFRRFCGCFPRNLQIFELFVDLFAVQSFFGEIKKNRPQTKIIALDFWEARLFQFLFFVLKNRLEDPGFLLAEHTLLANFVKFSHELILLVLVPIFLFVGKPLRTIFNVIQKTHQV